MFGVCIRTCIPKRNIGRVASAQNGLLIPVSSHKSHTWTHYLAPETSATRSIFVIHQVKFIISSDNPNGDSHRRDVGSKLVKSCTLRDDQLIVLKGKMLLASTLYLSDSCWSKLFKSSRN
ncbi:hypothetical protein J6590_001959 [Homalodisca vitripennis]|nr:hypothetical protein J6590_001959 [Homalodisca vitripennis]